MRNKIQILECSCGCQFSTQIWKDEKITNSMCPKCHNAQSMDKYLVREVHNDYF